MYNYKTTPLMVLSLNDSKALSINHISFSTIQTTPTYKNLNIL